MGDYKVMLGNGTCSSISITETRLQCQPPTEQPNQLADGHIITVALQVVVGENYTILLFPSKTLKTTIPLNTKHLYNMYTMLDQRRRRWPMLYICYTNV